MTNDIENAEQNDLAEAWDALLIQADKVFDRRGSVNIAICRMSTLRPDRQRLLRDDAGLATAELCQTIRQAIEVGEEIARWLERLDFDDSEKPRHDAGGSH